jgi:hypothetical protein
MSDKGDEKDMEVAAKTPEINRAKLWEKAKKNTVRNEVGYTVSTQNDPYRKEPNWKTTIKDSK